MEKKGSDKSTPRLQYLVVRKFIMDYAKKFNVPLDLAVYQVISDAEKFKRECRPKLPPRSGRKRINSVKPKRIFDNRPLVVFLKFVALCLFIGAVVLMTMLVFHKDF